MSRSGSNQSLGRHKSQASMTRVGSNQSLRSQQASSSPLYKSPSHEMLLLQTHRSMHFPMTTTGRLAALIKTLYSPDAAVVTSSLMQLHTMVDNNAEASTSSSRSSAPADANDLLDNTLELAVVRRGGHLAVMRALQTHVKAEPIQALGWAALAW